MNHCCLCACSPGVVPLGKFRTVQHLKSMLASIGLNKLKYWVRPGGLKLDDSDFHSYYMLLARISIDKTQSKSELSNFKLICQFSSSILQNDFRGARYMPHIHISMLSPGNVPLGQFERYNIWEAF